MERRWHVAYQAADGAVRVEDELRDYPPREVTFPLASRPEWIYNESIAHPCCPNLKIRRYILMQRVLVGRNFGFAVYQEQD
jgi:hypothetical protein